MGIGRGKKKGIPKDIIEELDITKKENKKEYEVNVIVEEHQAKIPIPKRIRLSMKLNKGTKCIMKYDKAKKELVCKF